MAVTAVVLRAWFGNMREAWFELLPAGIGPSQTTSQAATIRTRRLSDGSDHTTNVDIARSQRPPRQTHCLGVHHLQDGWQACPPIRRSVESGRRRAGAGPPPTGDRP